MALETVRILILSDDLVPVPLEDVTVRAFDETGATFITSALTDGDGYADLTLDGDDPAEVYQLRFYKVGVSIQSPAQIEVYSPVSESPTGTNDFTLTGHVQTLPEATDPRLCRASGIVRGPDGRPRAGIDMSFVFLFDPVIAAPDVVLGERINTRSDKNGYIAIDLWRGACYLVTVESHENVQREVVVPDRASLNIGDLLFPVVAKVEFDPPGPWTVAVGATLEITPLVTGSDFRILAGNAQEDVSYSSADVGVAAVSILGADRILISGVAPGTTELTIARLDASIRRYLDPGIDGTPVAITVS